MRCGTSQNWPGYDNPSQGNQTIPAAKRVRIAFQTLWANSVVSLGLESFPTLPSTLKCLCEYSAVPPGLELLFPLFPALTRWANMFRPFAGLDYRRVRSTQLLPSRFSDRL